MNSLDNVNDLVFGFNAAMIFSSFDEDESPEDCEQSPECEAMIKAICTIFALRCGHLFSDGPDQTNSDLNHIQSIGADLLYTIQGAGVGLWEDDKYPKYHTYLTSQAKDFYFEPTISSGTIYC